MVRYQSVELNWFGSVKKLKYRLDREGLSVIRGKNGSGKTTIFNALAWGLYGKVIKKNCTVEPYAWILDDSYKGTYTKVVYYRGDSKREVYHCKSYKGEITPGKKGKNDMYLFIDGVFQAKLRDKDDIKKWIINDTGYTFELFKTSILFGQKVKRIMEEDTAARNKVLEEAFEVAFITQARDKVSKELDAQLIDQKLIQSDINHLTHYKNTTIEYLDNVEDLKLRFKQDKHDKILKYRGEINRIKEAQYDNLKKIKKLNDPGPSLKKLNKRLFKLTPLNRDALVDAELKLSLSLETIKGRLENTKKKLEQTQKDIWGIKKNCVACGAPISKKEIKRQKGALKKLLKEYKEEIASYKITINEAQEAYVKITKELASFKDIEKKKSKIENKIKKLESREELLKRSEQLTISFSDKISTYEGLIKEQKERRFKREFKNTQIKKKQKYLNTLTKNIAELQTKEKELQEKIDINQWLIKDPLSNSGLKAFIFDTMLQKTNQELMKYENISGFRIHMGMKLENKRKDFEIKVFKEGTEHEVPHADLSGGQMQLCDVCIALSIHDTLKDNKECNLMLFDEVFESLDKENIEKVGELLILKGQGKCTHIITHTNFNPVGAYETSLKLKNGVTKTAAQ